MLHARTYVANSTIQNAGNGLFAEERIHRGQTVADYTDAKPITYAQFRRLVDANASTHVARIGLQYYDGRGFVAGYINRPARNSKPNARMLQSGRIVAVRSIPAGQELFMGYGPKYHL